MTLDTIARVIVVISMIGVIVLSLRFVIGADPHAWWKGENPRRRAILLAAVIVQALVSCAILAILAEVLSPS